MCMRWHALHELNVEQYCPEKNNKSNEDNMPSHKTFVNPAFQCLICQVLAAQYGLLYLFEFCRRKNID